jgi:hypothetical protein
LRFLLDPNITTNHGALTLIANDELANGVADGQRDPRQAVVTMASGTTLNMGTGTLTAKLPDGVTVNS